MNTDHRFLIIAICLLPTAVRAGNTQFRKTPFGAGAEVGFGLVKYRDTCVWFRVLFVSGDFFRDLRGHKTPNGIEFRRRKEKTSSISFPDPLLVDVEAFPHKCSAEMTPPDYAAGLMEKASFKVAWKSGNEAHPVELLAAEERHDRLSFGWSYLLTVPSQAVPLTNSLELDVSLRGGMCQAHFTANLDSVQRRLFPNTCK